MHDLVGHCELGGVSVGGDEEDAEDGDKVVEGDVQGGEDHAVLEMEGPGEDH